jgi:septal ring-binding cell division protein DamX
MSKGDAGETRSFLSSAFLVAAVAVVMLLGMFLKTEAPHELAPAAGPASPAPSLPLGSTVTPELPRAAAVEAPPRAEPMRVLAVDPLVAKLAARVEGDCGRLAKAQGRWTAQLMVACKPETVDRLLAKARGSRGLYVLPIQVNDDACFRVCFGAYQTSEEAAQASNLPRALRGKEKIGVVEIAKVLP